MGERLCKTPEPMRVLSMLNVKEARVGKGEEKKPVFLDARSSQTPVPCKVKYQTLIQSAWLCLRLLGGCLVSLFLLLPSLSRLSFRE